MKLGKWGSIGFLLTFLALNMATTSTWSCTGLQLKAKDGSYVNGRTLEFGQPLDLSLLVIPRHYAFTGTLPDGSTGLAYKAKYAAVGSSTFGAAALVDGVNEKGLTAAAFYFPNYAKYSSATPENKSKALSPTEFTNWLLTQFATVEEVKQGLKSVVIVASIPKGWPLVPPFHYVVYDKTGKSLVIEPINGKLVTYDNPIGVITNSPSFDWHLTNLSNYINLSPQNAAPMSLDGLTVKQLGQGSGLHGLPGDFTPPSRLVRAAVFSASALPSSTAAQTVLQVFHLLNQFDIPLGAVRSEHKGSTIYDSTLSTLR